MLQVEGKGQSQSLVKKGTGNIHVNGLKMSEYFKRPVHQIIVTRPLEISDVSKIMMLNAQKVAVYRVKQVQLF